MAHFGILNVKKPAGISSRDVVDRVERVARPAKCGHAGTLDPLATGVLVICIGPATRLIQYVQRMPKRYRATFLLGHHSPTDDVEGEVTPVEGAPTPTQAEIEAALPQFLGRISQVPPIHSAVKVAGRRAYAMARRGQHVELPARTVMIHRLEVQGYEHPELKLDIECGSGTYVRSLGRDLAAALGTAAVMTALERTAIGDFRVEKSVRLDELSVENLSLHIQPPLAAVADLPRIVLSDEQVEEIRHGRPIPASAEVDQAEGEQDQGAALDSEGHLVAIVRQKRVGQWWPALNMMSR